MKKSVLMLVLTIALVSSILSGCKGKDKNTTVTVNEHTVVDDK